MSMKTYMEARTTTNMKKGWIYRTSSDENNEEIAPFDWDSGSSDDDDDLVMIQFWWWSSDDTDLMMIQWCSISSDDPDSMMIQTWWRWIDNEDDLMMNMTWRWIWIDDDLDDIEKKTCADKLCRENTFLVKRECWCICNFGMYSLVYLMYCTPMFIPGSIYNVIESFHAPMLRPRDSIL